MISKRISGEFDIRSNESYPASGHPCMLLERSFELRLEECTTQPTKLSGVNGQELLDNFLSKESVRRNESIYTPVYIANQCTKFPEGSVVKTFQIQWRYQSQEKRIEMLMPAESCIEQISTKSIDQKLTTDELEKLSLNESFQMLIFEEDDEFICLDDICIEESWASSEHHMPISPRSAP